jgi:RNA polymerase sigma factor (sigma-70 family)
MNRILEGAWWSEARALAVRLSRRGASDAAEDLAQDLAVRALEAGSVAERPGAWLERVARNQVIDHWRVERRRLELAPELEPPPAPRDPEAHLLARERRRAIRQALRVLPRDQREAAVLRYYGGLPFEAVAARLGTEPATARTRVHRALARLRIRVGGLRALFVGWQGAQATALGLALVGVAGVAPSLAPGAPAVPLAAATQPAPRPPHAARGPAPLITAPPARSADHPPAPARRKSTPDPGPGREPAPQELRFEDDFVDGTVGAPEGDPIVVVQPTTHVSLIEIRRQLIPEMLKSLEDL